MKKTERIERNFVFQNQTTLETAISKVFLDIQESVANILPAFQIFQNLHELQFKIYDFSSNKYLPLEGLLLNDFNLEPRIYINAKFIQSEIILIKYSLNEGKDDSQSLHKSDTSSAKKERSKERTIAEVIDIVREWRQLHLKPKNRKRLNLQQAAEVIGISKKSLDDYYYQLRLGEKYDFDFKSHLNDRIGVLRTYIKEKKTQLKVDDKKQKLTKHPKQLKIIEELNEIDLMPYRRSSRSSKNSSDGMDIEENHSKEIEGQCSIMMDDDRKSVKSIEDQFQNDFEFLLDDVQDPFLNLEYDFKRKKNEEENQIFFF